MDKHTFNSVYFCLLLTLFNETFLYIFCFSNTDRENSFIVVTVVHAMGPDLN